MGEFYYFNERSTALKLVENYEICEDTVNPFVDDEIHNKYDKSYKYLFSVKKNFIDFVKTFMKINLNVELTEENITLLDKEFITKEFDKQESDIIYEVRAENKIVYFVLLELQHKNDRKMAYRILNYMVEIWRKWENSRLSGKKFVLPKIIPCVLYNGEDKWTAPVELKALYEDIGEEEEYLLNFKYILIDIYRCKPEDLYRVGNIISSAFYLDTAGKEKFWERFNELNESLKKMDKESWKIFMTWVTKMFVIDEKNRNEIEEKMLSEEDKNMGTLAMIREEIFNDGKMVGIQEGFNDGKIVGIQEGFNDGKIVGIQEGFNDGKIVGIQEGFNDGKIVGIREGFKDGKLSSIKRMIEYKLKVKLSLRRIKQIEKASIEQLEEIEKKIFEITSWDEIEAILNI